MVNDGAWLANCSISNVHVGKAPPTFAVLLVLPGPSIVTLSPTTGGAPVDQLSALVQIGFGPAPVQVSAASKVDALAAQKRRVSAPTRRRAAICSLRPTVPITQSPEDTFRWPEKARRVRGRMSI